MLQRDQKHPVIRNHDTARRLMSLKELGHQNQPVTSLRLERRHRTRSRSDIRFRMNGKENIKYGMYHVMLDQ